MTKRMLVDATQPEETRVVVINGNRLEDLDFEIASRKQLKGNIYLAKVTRVEPSLQAAFVEYGGNRHGFLAFSEIHPDYYRIPVADREALLAEERRLEEEEEEETQAPRGGRSGNGRRYGRRGRNRYDNGAGGRRGEEAAGGGEAETGDDAARVGSLNDAAGDEIGAEAADFVESPDDEMSDPGTAAEAVLPADAAADEPAAAGGDGDAGADSGTEPVGTIVRAAEIRSEVLAPEPPLVVDDTGLLPEGDPDVGIADIGEADTNDALDIAAGNGGEMPPVVVDEIGGDEVEEIARRPRRPLRSYKIQEVIKRRQILLVQVTKEERGTKGAALTTYLSLPGRYCVLMPNTGRGGGISRKITNPQDRKRLKEMLSDLDVPQGMAVILRTAGMERTKPEIKRDLEYLLRLWDSIREQTLQSTAPELIYEEANLIKRSIRDLYTNDIDELLVEGENGYATARDFMRMLMPSHTKRVQHYNDEAMPLYFRYQVESQIDAIHSPVVQLRSGGYLVINPTEALVAIDVNSGRSTRERNIEETAFKTNLEAADEVARQLRLRDLAGLIVIDFIDMEDPRNNAAVERRLKEALKNDRARIQIGRISAFGLLELSRQRLRPSLMEINYERCPHCSGTGAVRSVESAALHVLRAIEEEGIRRRSSEITVAVPSRIGFYILNVKRVELARIEVRYGFRVNIQADDTLIVPDLRLERVRARGAGDEVPAAITAEKVYVEAARGLVAESVEETEEEGADEEEAEESGRAAEAAPVPAANGEDGRDRRGGRRRRRRRPSGERSGEGSFAAAVPALEPSEGGSELSPELPAGAFDGEVDDTDGGAGEGDEAAAGFAGEGESSAEAQARKRRRGKRGGRRRGRGRPDGMAPEFQAEASPDDEDDTEPVEPADAPAAVLPQVMPVVMAPMDEEFDWFLEGDRPLPAAQSPGRATEPSAAVPVIAGGDGWVSIPVIMPEPVPAPVPAVPANPAEAEPRSEAMAVESAATEGAAAPAEAESAAPADEPVTRRRRTRRSEAAEGETPRRRTSRRRSAAAEEAPPAIAEPVAEATSAEAAPASETVGEDAAVVASAVVPPEAAPSQEAALPVAEAEALAPVAEAPPPRVTEIVNPPSEKPRRGWWSR